MKKTFAFLTILFSMCTIIYGQSSANLDEKNGFKDIKLGDSYEKWKWDLKYLDVNTDNEKLYNYTGACCQDVFGKPVEKIVIITANEKITCIIITLKPYQDNRLTGFPAKFRYPNDDFTKLTADFKSLFGEPREGLPNKAKSIMYCNIWKGQKVVLQVEYYFMGDYDYSEITVLDKIYYDKQK
ncbi:MAG: hypothetical protein WBM13_01770 [Bacteroidia bacterium]